MHWQALLARLMAAALLWTFSRMCSRQRRDAAITVYSTCGCCHQCSMRIINTERFIYMQGGDVSGSGIERRRGLRAGGEERGHFLYNKTRSQQGAMRTTSPQASRETVATTDRPLSHKERGYLGVVSGAGSCQRGAAPRVVDPGHLAAVRRRPLYISTGHGS